MEIPKSDINAKPSIYIGLFLTSFAILALEISLTRLLSILTWYHLAFFAVSTAILGMTVGSVTVYFYPAWFSPEKLLKNLAIISLCGAITIPFCLLVLLQIPIRSPIPSLVTITLFSFLPFLVLGTTISAIITKTALPIGKLYASDLAGAAAGCMVVLIGLEMISTPKMILACSAIASLAAICFSWKAGFSLHRNLGIVFFTASIFLVLANPLPDSLLRPVTAKGKFEDRKYFLEKWNSYSRVTVSNPDEVEPHYWSPSPKRPLDFKTIQYALKIDSDAGTSIRKFATLEDIDHLRYEGTNLVHYIRPHGLACIIGFGGGKDILGAILFGHEQIIGIEVNRIFLDLLENQFKDFAGIAGYPGVELVADEARSYLARNDLKCSMIQMALIDTWAATGAGAFSLSENGLYTTDAWELFLNRLGDDGILTVSRWYNPDNLGETGRLISLAVDTLLKAGVEDPSQHLAMIRVNAVATLLLSKKPFTQQELQTIKSVSDEMQYDLILFPGLEPQNEILKGVVDARSENQLMDFSRKQFYNISPPTDEDPYFFNQLRLRYIRQGLAKSPGIIRGNLNASVTLVGLIISLALMAFVTVVMPIRIKERHQPAINRDRKMRTWAGLYFSLIGAGFMLVEIALIQRFSVFLGHPVYSLGVLLFTIIASSGLGSFFSERLPLDRREVNFLLPVLISGMILIGRLAITRLMPALEPVSMTGKIIASILMIAPLGCVMGFFFPMGMRLVRKRDDDNSPWYWALNGIFGTLFSALAVFISIYYGISYNFYLAILCYLSLLVPLYFFNKSTISKSG